jgi:hypothetical protein
LGAGTSDCKAFVSALASFSSSAFFLASAAVCSKQEYDELKLLSAMFLRIKDKSRQNDSTYQTYLGFLCLDHLELGFFCLGFGFGGL